jgi:hypothetical protein
MSVERNVTLHDGAELTSGNGNTFTIDGLYGAAYLNVKSVAGSPGTLDVIVEERDPVTGQFYTVATFAQVAQSTTKEKVALPTLFTNTLRASWTVVGGSPGYDFEVGIYTKE